MPNSPYILLEDAEGSTTEAAAADGVTTTDLAVLKQRRKQNVDLMIASNFLGTLVFSIIQWNIFDAYISFLSSSMGMVYINSSVGIAESVSGITALILAVPVGLLVDNYCRTKVIKWSVVLGLLSTVVAVYAFSNDNLYAIYVNLFLSGCYSELAASASEAVFADSIPTGHRSKYFTRKGQAERLGLSLGPAIMVALFYFVGNEWTLRQLHIPLLLGCAIAPVPMIMLWFVKEPQSEIDCPFSPSPPPQAPLRAQVLMASPMTVHEQLTCASPTLHLPVQPRSQTAPSDAFPESTGWHYTSFIPYIVTLSDFVRKVGAGMTIKFFPLFFINDYGFKPIHINVLFCVYPIFMAAACYVLQRFADRLGRSQAVLIFQLSGIAFLFGMCYLENVWLMVIFFILRGSFQNAGYPIDRSIIMDYIPSNRRGIWNAVESITSMTWSGSAVVGGVLADTRDYRYTFFITACIYLVGSAVYVPLLWMVPKNEKDVVASIRKSMARKKSVPGDPFDSDNEDSLRSSLMSTVDGDAPSMVVINSEERLTFAAVESGGEESGNSNVPDGATVMSVK